MWTRFMDMHSGGGTKEEPYQYIYIEAPIHEAKLIFQNKFDHNPERVTCTCCGDDYSIDEGETLEQLTAYERGCEFGYVDKDGNEVPESAAWQTGKGYINGAQSKYFERESKRFTGGGSGYKTLDEYLKEPTVLCVREAEIKPEWRTGELRRQGYFWAD